MSAAPTVPEAGAGDRSPGDRPPAELLTRLQAYLAARSTLTLATAGPGGAPQAADLFFVADQALNLYFVSSPGSRHSRALISDPQVAATVHAETWEWQAISGLQLEGRVRALDGAEREAALARYSAKFPFVERFAVELAASACYCLTPDWLRWLDNSRGFGHRVEWRRGG
jgi:uncharacterized protein YhbP (UPF0306 family)